jgi:hypothetical protein
LSGASGPAKGIGLIVLCIVLLSSSGIALEDGERFGDGPSGESANWFRDEGDYLVHLTLRDASPRDPLLFVLSDMSSFETCIGKRLRLGSPAKWFHWGIDFSVFTSLTRYGVWNFKNITCDARYGLFGLFYIKPAILLLRLGHDCSNFLQGAPEFSKPIRFSQYYVYGRLLWPISLDSVPGIKSLKPYAGVGAYLYQYPQSCHLPFDFGLGIESKEFLFPHKTLHLGIDCSFNGMQRYAPTCGLFLGWGTSTEITNPRLPFSFGVFYQWGQDARGQYYERKRRLLGIKINMFY